MIKLSYIFENSYKILAQFRWHKNNSQKIYMSYFHLIFFSSFFIRTVHKVLKYNYVLYCISVIVGYEILVQTFYIKCGILSCFVIFSQFEIFRASLLIDVVILVLFMPRTGFCSTLNKYK